MQGKYIVAIVIIAVLIVAAVFFVYISVGSGTTNTPISNNETSQLTLAAKSQVGNATIENFTGDISLRAQTIKSCGPGTNCGIETPGTATLTMMAPYPGYIIIETEGNVNLSDIIGGISNGNVSPSVYSLYGKIKEFVPVVAGNISYALRNEGNKPVNLLIKVVYVGYKTQVVYNRSVYNYNSSVPTILINVPYSGYMVFNVPFGGFDMWAINYNSTNNYNMTNNGCSSSDYSIYLCSVNSNPSYYLRSWVHYNSPIIIPVVEGTLNLTLGSNDGLGPVGPSSNVVVQAEYVRNLP